MYYVFVDEDVTSGLLATYVYWFKVGMRRFAGCIGMYKDGLLQP